MNCGREISVTKHNETRVWSVYGIFMKYVPSEPVFFIRIINKKNFSYHSHCDILGIGCVSAPRVLM